MDEVNRGNFNIFFRVNNNFIDYLSKRESWGSDIVSQVTPKRGSHLLRHVAWQITGDKQYLEEYYADQIQTASQRMDMYTEGHWWTDRVGLDSTGLQRSRLGGIALRRSSIYPGHNVSWKFKAPATGESVAILIPDATTKHMKIIAYNLENIPVTADMTAWDIDPGKWEVSVGIDSDGNDKPNTISSKRTVSLERSGNLELTFPPGKTTIVQLKLKSHDRHYWKRPDLGIGDADVRIQGNTVLVTVHSLGSVNTPASSVALIDASGKTITAVHVPVLKAPLDYIPKTAELTLHVPAGTKLSGCSVCIDPEKNIAEITKRNNHVQIP